MDVDIEENGAAEAAEMFESLAKNATQIPEVLDKAGEDISERSKSLASAKGLYKTGKGVAGINWDRATVYTRTVGWGSRPNLHLYFHEIGTYKDPPRPHIRPAALGYEHTLVDNVKRTLYRI